MDLVFKLFEFCFLCSFVICGSFDCIILRFPDFVCGFSGQVFYIIFVFYLLWFMVDSSVLLLF